MPRLLKHHQRQESRWRRSRAQPAASSQQLAASNADAFSGSNSNKQAIDHRGDSSPPPGKVLFCPVRGWLDTAAMAKDGLTPTEESRRIEFLHFLIDHGYPKANIDVETVVLKKLGEQGRNKLRCDVLAYRKPASELRHLSLDDRIKEAVLVAEIKRDGSQKKSGVDYQLKPAMRQLPSMGVMGAYWDDTSRLLLVKQLVKKNGHHDVEIIEDTLSHLPRFEVPYTAKPLVYADLDKTANVYGVLLRIANAMRSHGVNDDQTRYKETVKLLLARYCDEKECQGDPDQPLSLQVYPGTDPDFRKRVGAVYDTAAKRYSKAKSIFNPVSGTELSEKALREIVRTIQGIEFRSASNETMQQVFMSFVPAVFKKSLDQYFTPLGLIEAVVSMVRVGPNDQVADPGMGTADFLTAVMEYRTKRGDTDVNQRVFGMDVDQKAFDLAVVNMILNKDGQSGLRCVDSIEKHSLHAGAMQVVLCNPPFGEQSVEKNPSVLKAYDLGHRWEWDETARRWEKTDDLLPSQQLGILFIERCVKMADDKGRIGIILPEGYLCTPIYGYVRQWIVDNLRILSLTELPRRIFVRSGVDLRSNILIAQKLTASSLATLKKSDYPIHAEMVRKVGFKMGKGNQAINVRDPATGIEVRDKDNKLIPDTDFRRVLDGFDRYTAATKWDRGSTSPVGPSWDGARLSDILRHPGLDLKPRRLMPRALANVRAVKKGSHVALKDIAVVQDVTMDVRAGGTERLWRLVEGQDVRAVEGFVMPGHPTRAWQIAERKTKSVYRIIGGDIIIGLVRPERRNIGIMLATGDDIVGAPDGIAVVRVKPESQKEYPQEWLLAALRSEACRLQFWTESGGTSYGKLTDAMIRDVLVPTPPIAERQEIAEKVKGWLKRTRGASESWDQIGAPEDRYPVLNSASFGLVDSPVDGSEMDEE